MPAPVVFLDKDGTLVEDVPYNADPARVRLAPGAGKPPGGFGEDSVVAWHTLEQKMMEKNGH